MKNFPLGIIIAFFVWAFAPYFANGIENYPAGSRFIGMADCGVAIPDLWSISHNQAGIAYIEKPTFGLYHEQRFMIKELSLSSIATIIPVSYGCFGAQLNYFGYSKYHELKAGLAYAKKLGKRFSAGIQLNYFSTFIPSSENQFKRINFELGLMFLPYDNFTVGFHVFNPIADRKTETTEINIPTQAQFGIAYNIRKILTIAAQTEAGYANQPIYSLGMEYLPVSVLALRLGLSSGSTNYSFGIGYINKHFQTNIAFSNHSILGVTPHFDVLVNL